jgi:hypothetical protein
MEIRTRCNCPSDSTVCNGVPFKLHRSNCHPPCCPAVPSVTYQDQDNSPLSRRINAIPLTFINQKPFEAGTARHRDGEPVYFTGTYWQLVSSRGSTPCLNICHYRNEPLCTSRRQNPSLSQHQLAHTASSLHHLFRFLVPVS